MIPYFRRCLICHLVLLDWTYLWNSFVVSLPPPANCVLGPDYFFTTVVADNPQTFHQALLLVANLARLAPDSVLRNVMPIFTFMGSNVFHRDDTYSFRVVQQVTNSPFVLS